MIAKEWFDKARRENFAIGAFNVDNLEIFKAICLAASKMKSPVMMEFSQGEAGYFGLDNIASLVANARGEYKIPILLNLDHAKKVEDCLKAIEIGSPSTGSGSSSFDEVHFDGSELSFEENVKEAKKVVEAGHLPAGRQVLVEGEIDRLAGSSEAHTDEVDLDVLKNSYTKPEKAAEFVEKTGIDIFAAVFGNVHGTFPNQPDLDVDLLAKIRKALPDTFLSMHGGSGIPADQVKKAIEIGKIVKINVNTELRVAFRDALEEEIGEKPGETAYYKLTPDVVEAVAAVVEGKIGVFGSAGKIA